MTTTAARTYLLHGDFPPIGTFYPLDLTHYYIYLTGGRPVHMAHAALHKYYYELQRHIGLRINDAPSHSLASGWRRRYVPPPIFDLGEAEKQGNEQLVSAAAGPKPAAKGGMAGPQPKGIKDAVKQVVKRLRNGMTIIVDEDNVWEADDYYYGEPKVGYGATSGNKGLTDSPPPKPSKKIPEDEEPRPAAAVRPVSPADNLLLYSQGPASPAAANG